MEELVEKKEEAVEEKKEEKDFSNLKNHFPLYFDIGEMNHIEVPICKPNCNKCWGKGYVKGKSNVDLKFKYPLVNNTGEDVLICKRSVLAGINLEAYANMIAETTNRQ